MIHAERADDLRGPFGREREQRTGRVHIYARAGQQVHGLFPFAVAAQVRANRREAGEAPHHLGHAARVGIGIALIARVDQHGQTALQSLEHFERARLVEGE